MISAIMDLCTNPFLGIVTKIYNWNCVQSIVLKLQQVQYSNLGDRNYIQFILSLKRHAIDSILNYHHGIGYNFHNENYAQFLYTITGNRYKNLVWNYVEFFQLSFKIKWI